MADLPLHSQENDVDHGLEVEEGFSIDLFAVMLTTDADDLQHGTELLLLKLWSLIRKPGAGADEERTLTTA